MDLKELEPTYILVDSNSYICSRVYSIISYMKKKYKCEYNSFVNMYKNCKNIQWFRNDTFRNIFTRTFWNKLIYLKKIYTNAIIIWIKDGNWSENGWRIQFFSGYKKHTIAKWNLEISTSPDFLEIHDWINKNISSTNIINYIVKDTSEEADDVIYTFTTLTKENIIIISDDKDFHQLLEQNNVNILTTNFEIIDRNIGKETLTRKIMFGDRSDSIPKARSESDITRNRLLIDFRFIPPDVIDNISKSIQTIF